MLDILEEVNFGIKPKLVKCLQVHNEEDWVEYNLANNYDEYDVIRVVEGAVEGRPNSTPDGHSTDATLELVRSFPDPDNKIELYTQDRPFKSLEELKQTFLDVANDGDWLFITDADEFYLEGEVNRVRDLIYRRPTASEFIPVFLHFYRDFSHIKAPHPEWQPNHQRILRYRKGLRYHTHPVATDEAGRCTYFDGNYQFKRFMVPDLLIFHYGHAKGREFHEMKKQFYENELAKFKLADGTDASQKFDEKFVEFCEYSEPLDSILEYDGEHPMALEGHPSRKQREPFYENKSFENWRNHFIYSSERLPTIPLLMMGKWKQTKPIYNYL